MQALLTRFTSRPGRTAQPASEALNLPALVGPAGWSRLPMAVQHRFAVDHADTVYDGRMDVYCSGIGRVYAWLALAVGGPLTRMNAQAIPTRVRVSSNHRGGVVWERCFRPTSGATTQTVRSTKELGTDGGLMERTDGGLSMSLDVFEENGSLVFLSRQYWLVLGHLRLPIPTWMTPGTCRVTHTDLGHGRFRFTLSMRHPLWGETFHQSGIFADPELPATTESTL